MDEQMFVTPVGIFQEFLKHKEVFEEETGSVLRKTTRNLSG
jgi:hypothetical protein